VQDPGEPLQQLVERSYDYAIRRQTIETAFQADE
jgi:hypothetical protein